MGTHALKKERVRDYLIPAPTWKSPEIIYPFDKLGAVKRRTCTDGCNMASLSGGWDRTYSHGLILTKEAVLCWTVVERFCLSAHAAHISNYINQRRFSVHGKMVSLLKGHSSFLIYCVLPLFSFLDLLAFFPSLFLICAMSLSSLCIYDREPVWQGDQRHFFFFSDVAL